VLKLDLPEPYEALRKRVRAFVDELLIPLEGQSIAGTDLKPEIRARLEDEAKRRDLWNLHVPPEFGGQAGDMLSRIVIWQELGRTTAIPPRRTAVFGPDPGPILYQLAEHQREAYLWPVLRGEKKCAFAQTEPGAGADPAGMSTTAVRDGDHYVINGRKRFIGFADEADFIQVVALTDPVKRARGGISTFLVDTDTPGFRVVRRLETMMVDRPTELEFVNVRVPAANLIGTEGDGFRLAQSWITEGRLARHGARGSGVIERCLELGVAYAGERETFGTKLADRQSIQFMLVDMYQHLYQIRLMLYDVARRFDAGEDVRTESYICKYFGDEAAFHAADRCMQIHGAIGLTTDYPIETFWKQSRSFIITEGPTEVMKMVIARKVFADFAPPATVTA
jgi:acyl-CoA dehydrogenase